MVNAKYQSYCSEKSLLHTKIVFVSNPKSGFLLAIFSVFAYVPFVNAWSSLDLFMFEDVHQLAIERVLGELLQNDDYLKILKEQQRIVDKDQAPEQSHEHAMTGINKTGDEFYTQRKLFILQANNSLQYLLNQAVQKRKTGDFQSAMSSLGKAIHILSDSTSPTHICFQEWSFNVGFFEKVRHVFNESVYPEGDGINENHRLRLEASIRWAYDMYIEKLPIPAIYFDNGGILQIPSKYKAPQPSIDKNKSQICTKETSV